MCERLRVAQSEPQKTDAAIQSASHLRRIIIYIALAAL